MKKSDVKPSDVKPSDVKPSDEDPPRRWHKEWHPKVEEKQRIEELAKKMLIRGYSKASIKKAIREFVHEKLNGPKSLDPKTCENYLRRARESMLLDLAEGRKFFRAQALGFYQEKKQNAKNDETQIKAQDLICKLLGLYVERAPKIESTDEQISILEKAIAERLHNEPGTIVGHEIGDRKIPLDVTPKEQAE